MEHPSSVLFVEDQRFDVPSAEGTPGDVLHPSFIYVSPAKLPSTQHGTVDVTISALKHHLASSPRYQPSLPTGKTIFCRSSDE